MKYKARMNSWVHDPDYPISKEFEKKVPTMSYIKRALNIYPYVKITLYACTKDKNCINEGVYSIDRKGKIIHKKG